MRHHSKVNLKQFRAGTRSGLTLVELLLVLFILSILAGVALTTSDGILDQSRYEATQNTIGSFRQAVLGPEVFNPSSTEGPGFVADMGRLPIAVDPVDDGLDGQTAAELWEVDALDTPSTDPLFGLKRAEEGNMQSDQQALEDEDIFVGTGWRGPYLRLPPGDSTWRDGFGYALVDGHLALKSEDGKLLVVGVSSFGADDDPGTDDGYNRNLPSATIQTGSYEARLSVTIEGVSVGETVNVRVYMPSPTETGRIAVLQEDIVIVANAENKVDLELTMGRRVLRVARVGSTNEPKRIPMVLKPGANDITIDLTGI